MCPVGGADLPHSIRARARISWWPAHFTLTWLDGGDSYQKISARPREGACERYSIEYYDSVFDTDVRAQYWRAFLTEPAPCPSRPQETKTSTEPASAQTTEPPPASPPEKAPPVSTEPAPSQSLEEEKTPMSEHSHSTNHTGTDYENDWREPRDWEYRNDWRNGNQGEWSESRHWTNQERANETLDTPRIHHPTFVIAQTPAELESVDNPASAIQSPIGNQSHPSRNDPFRVEQVTVQTKTQILEVDRSADGRFRSWKRKAARSPAMIV